MVALERRAPEARGRCERAFRTLQDRLPKGLALAGITTVEAANRFLREVYLPEHNRTFAVAPEEPASAFVVIPEALGRDVLAIQEDRRVGNDNCVAGRGRSLQLPPTPLRPHQVRATVRVHDDPDGTVAHLQRPAAPGQLPAGRTCDRRKPGRVTTATRPTLWTWWTTLRVAHNPTGPTTAVNSCATYCGQNNALATKFDGVRGPHGRDRGRGAGCNGSTAPSSF